MTEEIKPPSDKPEIAAKYTDLTPEEKTEFNIKELNGFIEILTSAPTYKARRLWEQVKMRSNGTLYVYDNKAGAWLNIRGGFPGTFDSAGNAGTPFPSGWSISKTGTGSYLITHNLGNTNYAVVATPFGFYNVVQVASQGSNSFELYAVDRATGASANTAMNFVLTLS